MASGHDKTKFTNKLLLNQKITGHIGTRAVLESRRSVAQRGPCQRLLLQKTVAVICQHSHHQQHKISTQPGLWK